MSRALRRWPLRIKLVLIAWLGVILALGISGPLIIILVRSSLIDQVDVQLHEAASDVAQTAATELATGSSADQPLPSDYFVQFQIGATRTSLQAGSAPNALGAVPNIPDLSPQVVGNGLAPTTLESVSGPTKWRVVALPVTVHSEGGIGRGTVAVALPLTTVETTLSQITTVIIVSGLSVLLIASGVTWYAVSRALRPLRAIEETALAIADGDLARRVEDAPLSTEVGRLAWALNAMLAQIEQAVVLRDISQEQLRQFVADASHELRTPLAVLRGYAELYRQGGIPPGEVAGVMNRIESEAARLGDLVGDLLALSQLDEASAAHGNTDLAGEPVENPVAATTNLTELISEATADLRALDPQREISVVPWRAPGPDLAVGPHSNHEVEAGAGAAVENPATVLEPLLVRASADQMRQILSNLIGNIVSHTPAGTPVEFAAGHFDSHRIVFEARDFGPGVTAAEAERMFDRFWRSDSGRSRQAGGAGLGLALVAAITGSLGGSVRAIPRDSGGLTVRVLLPAGNLR